MTDVHSPFISSTAQALLRTLVGLGQPSTVKDLISHCNPRPVTTREALILRWRQREQELHDAVEELHEAGIVTRNVEKRDGRVCHVIWLP